ncbi:MAG: hypothetical protein KME40_29385 [Komarekiella atlantica HA4396-MV6]|jgi:hypothetical protein|nr:hypothetical protein [Komarekiella atlantica HA4396-MV6]
MCIYSSFHLFKPQHQSILLSLRLRVHQSFDACLEKFPTAGNPPTELFATAGYANGGSRRSNFSLREVKM